MTGRAEQYSGCGVYGIWESTGYGKARTTKGRIKSKRRNPPEGTSRSDRMPNHSEEVQKKYVHVVLILVLMFKVERTIEKSPSKASFICSNCLVIIRVERVKPKHIICAIPEESI